MAGKNKVKFNIHNVHYAKRTVTEGVASYDTPKALPGAVSISLEAQGDLTPFYADGIKYYIASSNTGYEGDLELALVTDEFRQDILNETLDSNQVMIENAMTEAVQFALGFEIDGDQTGTKFWFYNCTATRPTVESETNEDGKEPNTDTLTVSCAADENGNVRAKTTETTTAETLAGWFNAVYLKAE